MEPFFVVCKKLVTWLTISISLCRPLESPNPGVSITFKVNGNLPPVAVLGWTE